MAQFLKLQGVELMQMWELVVRIFSSASGAQSLSPARIGREYRQFLVDTGRVDLPPEVDFERWAEIIASNMEHAGLLESAPPLRPGLGMLGARQKTSFGMELYIALQRKEVMNAFCSSNILIDVNQIKTALKGQ